MIPAVIQTAALAIGIHRCRRSYPAFLISLAASLPFLWISADLFRVHANWERYVWLPCAIVLIPAQMVAAMEACLRFGERYWLAPRISATMMVFPVAAVMVIWARPFGDVVGQMVQIARYQRLGCLAFLVAVTAFYGVLRPKGLVGRADGAHLILLTLWMITWTVPILRLIPATWPVWLEVRWMVTARTWLLVAWVGMVALRQPRLNPAHPQL